jgi:beta-RFAP synthase
LAFAHRFAAATPALAAQHLAVECAAPEHVGLGVGTQLGLAVAAVLARAAGLPDLGSADLARRVGRGERSALGVHGFAHGGFLVEAGKRPGEPLAPLVARMPFPDDWRIVLLWPANGRGLHGPAEREAFDRLVPDAAHADALCRLVLLDLLPALAEGDLDVFGEALFDFNARAGAAFAPIQGGTYSGRWVAEAVAYLRQQGVRGVGQSSWGPTVFAVVEDQDQAGFLAERARRQLDLSGKDVLITTGCNHAAVLEC